MKKIALLLILLIAFSSCNSTKTLVSHKSNTSKIDSNTLKTALNLQCSNELDTNYLTPSDLSPISLTIESRIPSSMPSKASRIVGHAFSFDGVRYKRGGTTTDGMDCSGLVAHTFDLENISLPRVSRDMAHVGNLIDLSEVSEGDLLFFATRKNSKTISHVGIVTTTRDGIVEFIHASTSNGVIVSKLSEKYWHAAFVQARRVI